MGVSGLETVLPHPEFSEAEGEASQNSRQVSSDRMGAHCFHRDCGNAMFPEFSRSANPHLRFTFATWKCCLRTLRSQLQEGLEALKQLEDVCEDEK